jgi:DNA-directed RNA polymerase specialized sigma24 family protein
VVARVCLDLLRSRKSRRDVALGTHLPDPIVSREDRLDPQHAALLADSIGLALLVVLETLTPAEWLAFVLHDIFAVPFDEIAAIVRRSPAAARQLASRARRRVQEAAPVPVFELTKEVETIKKRLAKLERSDESRDL